MRLKRRLIGFSVAFAALLGGVVAVSSVVPVGSGPVSAAASDPVQSLSPARLADTRPGEKTLDGVSAGIGRRDAGSVTTVQIAGRGGVPVGASAALLNLTSVLPSGNTFLTVFPCGGDRPNVSNLNSPVNDVRANSVFVKLSSAGTVCVYTVASTDFVIDVNGYVPAEASPVSVNPARLFDTRSGETTVDGQGVGIGRRAAGSVTEIQVAGRGGVPVGAAAAVLNLTSVLPSEGNFLTVFPCGGDRPNVSNLNSPVNDIRANTVFVKLSAAGKACVYTVAVTDFVIDVNGYVPTAGGPTSVNPTRLFDSRPGQATIDGQGVGSGRVAAGSVTEVQIGGRAGIPANATAAVINLTAVLPSEATYLTAFPCGGSRPNVSTLNLPANDIRANNAFIKLSDAGKICVYTVAATDFIIDINGYATPADTPPTTTTTLAPTTTTLAPTTTTTLPPQPALCTVNGTGVSSSLSGTECAALAALYNSTDGANWTNRRGWMTATDPCTWLGVGCTAGHVSSIYLSSNKLSGAIPDEIGNFSQLKSLVMGSNQLIGWIPESFGRLTSLAFIDLSDNQLWGTIPQSVWTFTGLTNLNFSDNQLWGSLPSEIANLNKLTHLLLHNNDLSGTIPASIGRLTNLTVLDLSGNHFFGSLPSEMGNLSKLTYLSLYSNDLTGTIPASIGRLASLNTVILADNQLSGPLPSEIGGLGKLTYLSLALNKITGTIPASVGGLTSLTVLNLYGNQLSGPLPSEIGGLSKLTYLSLAENEITGTIPASIGGLTSLTSLDLYRNQLSGPVPSEIGGLSKLTFLSLADNKITGVIPASIGGLTSLTDLNLSGNQLSGPIPPEIGSMSKLTSLNLSNNQLSGAVPSAIGGLTSLSFLYLSNNGLSGDLVPAFVPLMNTHLTTYFGLDLAGNGCFQAADPALVKWLDDKQSGWRNHAPGTICPAG